ncbi:MAG: bifunctional 23S rRNA (guanine(2069)-N(7))-methyltransferase RlmK/23S rRNA (guanine(2445)-N(2))-methyltransferase RlmL [Methylomonas sp.]|jgi:23S rRNA (guanine2445-N2)-methyltransferase / 23S rRNA (guanine2069-N7)-methyltransferase|uniref:bifunctional 23S rRNA (guanine(2069)-N(7))-methyltransferase RlmK/23S rRNA (guanine(2445)-N(2))-methyltransferase RlmL n=1 Tax=Methylomonas sp. TaxID=418 RepID=UPI0025D64355|nr:bifunctional 23S rRNA (guanine(2069)-N(7))-methyltransferase RlmK/23S rRNA (guanine(2445)-N(2))-methyltransferase RlmL [Methylomonas sp.]MCK9606631.1 bifunctional 23S rRNA (guanine(2069)-N(7))-methyltransferase RlmK/23S rRNA (guanine(2445)-N(2))-methyltransferase RlmL [Methylomonas sp.]
MSQYQLFATTPKAMEGILAAEIEALGGQQVQQKMAGVAFQGDLAMAYKACLWSRTANRILLLLGSFEVKSQQDLYDGVNRINWFEHLEPDDSLAVSFSSKNNPAINNTHFGALKVKDAIVDQMRAKFDKRPNIDTERPSIRINVYLHNETAQLSLDLSGESLHKRGYRDVSIAAPIKENLAAAILLRTGWPKIAAAGGSLLDPMCGSGTMLLEGAMIAADYAPGLLRDYYGFLGWKKHDAELWQNLLADANQRRDMGLKTLPVIVGFDQDRHTVATALQHVENAGLQGKIHIEKRDIADAAAAESWPKGLIACNPPYGERLGEEAETAELYRRFGEVLKSRFGGWQATMIISNPELGFRLGLRSQKPITLFNGALECKLLRFNIEEKSFFEPKAKSQQERIEQIGRRTQAEQVDTQAEMFGNRLRKNLKKLNKWVKQNQIHCYRVYDADLPEYAVAVDVYQGEQTWVNVQEYESPKTIDPAKANQRLAGAMVEIPKVLGIPKEQVFLKIRRKQKNTDQYEKQGDSGRFHVIEEGGCKFWVNFEDYLDTGLFLDHRPIRMLIQQQAQGKRFLNLFAYTGSASVLAAMGGAASSVTVDMSNTYLDWAKRNFDLNGIRGDHKLVRANCLTWLAEQAVAKPAAQFDLIFLDPPTFSNSKKMDDAFDVQNDHVQLLKNAAAILAPGGILYFSTNFRRFKMDAVSLAGLNIEDISAATIPEDFARDPKIHYCWRISR